MQQITRAFIKLEMLFILFALILGANLLKPQETGKTDYTPLSNAASTINSSTQQNPKLRPTFTATTVVIKVSQANSKPTSTPTQMVSPTEVSPTSASSFRSDRSANSNAALPHAVVQIAANIRSGPGTNYNIVGGVQIKTHVEIVGRNADGSWLRICCVADGENWIYTQLILLDKGIDLETVPIVASSVAVPTVPNVPTQSPSISLPVPVAPRLITTNRAANLRMGPDTASEVVGIAEARQTFTVIGQTQNGQWLLVCCDKGKDAWLISTYTASIATSPTPTRIYRTRESSIQIGEANSDIDINKSAERTCAYASDTNHLQLANGYVEQMPTGKAGDWIVSGRRFVVSIQTSLERERNLFGPDPKARRSEFRIGDRVDVEYCRENGQEYALEIEIQ